MTGRAAAVVTALVCQIFVAENSLTDALLGWYGAALAARAKMKSTKQSIRP
jgi:hypothetical protein